MYFSNERDKCIIYHVLCKCPEQKCITKEMQVLDESSDMLPSWEIVIDKSIKCHTHIWARVKTGKWMEKDEIHKKNLECFQITIKETLQMLILRMKPGFITLSQQCNKRNMDNHKTKRTLY